MHQSVSSQSRIHAVKVDWFWVHAMQCMSLRVYFVSEVDRPLRTVGDLNREFMLLKYNEFRSHVICIPVVVVKVDTTTADWTIRWWRARRRRCIHHPWRWLRRLLLLLCWWPRHTQRNKICSSRYNVDWWRWCFFWKHMYDCTLGTMKIRLKATLNRCVNSHHCMLIDECMHLSLKGHSEINLTVQQIYARWTKDFSCVHDLTCRSHCYMFVPLTVVIWPLTFTFAGPTAWNSLPDIIRSAESINTFKRLLKSFLFSVSYPGLSFSVTACYTYSLY